MFRCITVSIRSFLQDDHGSAAIEYGLLVAVFVALCMAVIGFFGDAIGLLQGDVVDALNNADNDV